MAVALSVTGCKSTKVDRLFCSEPLQLDDVAAVIDPDGSLDAPEVPAALRKSVLRYLFGAICGKPVCDLFPEEADVRACEEGYLRARAILQKKVRINYVSVGTVSGDAAIGLETDRGKRVFGVVFRRHADGSWLIFDPLQEAGRGVP